MTNITPLLLLILKFAVVEILFARGVEMQMLSVTRGKEDSFVADASSGCQCDTFNSNRTISHGDSKICSCRCPSDAPTFYFKNGEERCWKNAEVISDDEASCSYYFAREGSHSLRVVDLQIGQAMEQIEPDFGCKPLVVDHWQYRQNGNWWNSSLVNIFSVKMKKIEHSAIKKRPFLQWNRLPDRQYQGLLIKVILVCSFGGDEEKKCIMFKTHGTHTGSANPPMMVTIPTPSSALTLNTTTIQTGVKDNTEVDGEDKSDVPTIVGAAVAGLLGIIVAVVVTLVILRRKRKRASTSANTEPITDVYEEIPNQNGHTAPVDVAEDPSTVMRTNPRASESIGAQSCHVYEQLNQATRNLTYDYAVQTEFPAHFNFTGPESNAVSIDDADAAYLEPVQAGGVTSLSSSPGSAIPLERFDYVDVEEGMETLDEPIYYVSIVS